MARKEYETWQNRTRSEIWVNVTDNVRGDIKQVRVPAGGRIELTPEDRYRFNQEAAVDKAFDWFSNGSLSRIALVDTAEDYEEVIANPNTKSEKEIRELLDLHANELKKELAKIDSPLVLGRLKEYIDSDESDKAENISVAKVKAVNARYDELNPSKTGKVFDSYKEATAEDRAITLS